MIMFSNQDIKHSGETVDHIRKQLNIVEICDMIDPEIESQRLPRGINTIILGIIYHPYIMIYIIPNIIKTKEFNLSTSHVPHPLPALATGDETLEVIHTIKLLGVHLSAELKWSEHIKTYVQKRVSVYLHFEY